MVIKCFGFRLTWPQGGSRPLLSADALKRSDPEIKQQHIQGTCRYQKGTVSQRTAGHFGTCRKEPVCWPFDCWSCNSKMWPRRLVACLAASFGLTGTVAVEGPPRQSHFECLGIVPEMWCRHDFSVADVGETGTGHGRWQAGAELFQWSHTWWLVSNQTFFACIWFLFTLPCQFASSFFSARNHQAGPSR